MQFSKITTDLFNGDRDNIYNWYGVNYEAEDGTLLERDLGDGEKNAGFVLMLDFFKTKMYDVEPKVAPKWIPGGG